MGTNNRFIEDCVLLRISPERPPPGGPSSRKRVNITASLSCVTARIIWCPRHLDVGSLSGSELDGCWFKLTPRNQESFNRPTWSGSTPCSGLSSSSQIMLWIFSGMPVLLPRRSKFGLFENGEHPMAILPCHDKIEEAFADWVL